MIKWLNMPEKRNRFKGFFLLVISYATFFLFLTRESINLQISNLVNHQSSLLILAYFYLLIFIHIKINNLGVKGKFKSGLRLLFFVFNFMLTILLTFIDFETPALNNIDAFSPVILGLFTLLWFERNRS